MKPLPSLDKRLVRLHFDRVAARYDAAAVLQREVGSRLLQRLDLVRLEPHWILDAGSGTGWVGGQLALRYPRAAILELDLSLAMLLAGRRRAASRRREWWRPDWWCRLTGRTRRRLICADLERLPLASNSMQLVCSNFALAWMSQLDIALSELQRVLAPGGLLCFTTLGPDTLKELRAALGEQRAESVHPFPDMHDVGDLLVHCGFSDPVMDVEHITLTYADAHALLSELRAAGGRSALKGQPPGLRGRAWRKRLEMSYAQLGYGARLPLTFEIVFGHAWKPEHPRRVADGRAVIRVERPRASSVGDANAR